MTMGALLLAGGAREKRMALPNSKILIHQVSAASGQAPTSRSTPRRSSTSARLDEIIAKHTGQALEKVAKDTERDYFMSAEEAKEYPSRPRHRASLRAPELRCSSRAPPGARRGRPSQRGYLRSARGLGHAVSGLPRRGGWRADRFRSRLPRPPTSRSGSSAGVGRSGDTCCPGCRPAIRSRPGTG